MGDIEYFESLLSSIRKPQHGKRLLQILIALRKQVNSANHKAKISIIKDSNCLKPLVSFTQHDPNLKVVDLALSILGNCCTNQTVARLCITDYNILYNLNRILDKHKKDSIQGRVFRMLGNLCDAFQPIKLIQKEPSVITNVIQFLLVFATNGQLESDNDINEGQHIYTLATITMAIRFIRKALNHESFDVLALDHNMVKTMGFVFIKCSQGLKDNQNYKIIINDVLKIFQILSSPIYNHYDLIAELKNTGHGDSLECFKDIILLHPDPEKIVKIILKLAHLQKHQSDLPIATIVTNLIKEVDPNQSISIHREYLQCINKLMDNIGFHGKLGGTSNNISLLVNLFKEFKIDNDFTIHCCIAICSILIKCQYHEALMESQLNADIVTYIIEKLELISGLSTDTLQLELHQKNTKSGLRQDSKRFKRNECKEDVTLFNAMNFEVPKKRCVSPSSCSDVSSNGPFSPAPSSGLICYDSDSDNYSPICSENEDEPELNIETPEDELILSETEENRPILSKDQVLLRYKLKTDINTLLKRYVSLKRPLYQHLGTPKLMIILINIVFNGCLKNENCADSTFIIHQIAQNTAFMLPLMASGIISQVYELLEPKHGDLCADCEKLRELADKLFDKLMIGVLPGSVCGDIAHHIYKKYNDEVTEKLILALPYVIRDKFSLNKLLLKNDGLSILIKLLSNRTNTELQNKCIKSLCTLAADTLKIKSPVNKQLKSGYDTINVKVDHYVFVDCASIVSFKLDDGNTIKADRVFLNEKSDYFSTLLSCGRFIESEQNEITLKNVPTASLQCLLRLLQLEVNLKNTLDIDYDVETILDVILLADRFLLPELNYLLVCHVEQLLTSATAPIFYKWALESGTNIMRVESIAFALAGDISYKERLSMFYALINVGYFDELLEDVEKLIRQFL